MTNLSLISLALFGVIALGALLLLVGLVLLLRAVMSLMFGKQTEGIVVRLVEDQEDHMFAPVVKFNGDGQEFEFEHPVYQTPPYKIGDKVSVLYTPGNPKSARIKSFSALFMVPIVLGISGCICASGGLFLTQLK